MKAKLAPVGGEIPDFDTNGNSITEKGIVTTFFGRIVHFKITFRQKEIVRNPDGTKTEGFVTIFSDMAHEAVYKALARQGGRQK